MEDYSQGRSQFEARIDYVLDYVGH